MLVTMIDFFSLLDEYTYYIPSRWEVVEPDLEGDRFSETRIGTVGRSSCKDCTRKDAYGSPLRSTLITG